MAVTFLPDGWHQRLGWALFAEGRIVAHVERTGGKWRWRIAYDVKRAIDVTESWETAIAEASSAAKAAGDSGLFSQTTAEFLSRLWNGHRSDS